MIARIDHNKRRAANGSILAEAGKPEPAIAAREAIATAVPELTTGAQIAVAEAIALAIEAYRGAVADLETPALLAAVAAAAARAAAAHEVLRAWVAEGAAADPEGAVADDAADRPTSSRRNL